MLPTLYGTRALVGWLFRFLASHKRKGSRLLRGRGSVPIECASPHINARIALRGEGCFLILASPPLFHPPSSSRLLLVGRVFGKRDLIFHAGFVSPASLSSHLLSPFGTPYSMADSRTRSTLWTRDIFESAQSFSVAGFQRIGQSFRVRQMILKI